MKKKKTSNSLPVKQKSPQEIAVELFHNNVPKQDISRTLGVSRKTIWNWLTTYFKKGTPGIRKIKRGRPKGIQLEPWQGAQIVKDIINYCPDELSLPFSLWTREAVMALILKKFNISLSKWTIGRYLARWNFTVQKPINRAFEQDSKAIENWLKHDYPNIQKASKREKAEIHWGDEMGVRSDHTNGRTYGLKGKTPVIKRSGNRFSCNMISTVTNLGKLSFMIFEENFDENIFLRFLKKLVQQSNKKVFLIVDRHQAHRSKKVKTWLTSSEKSIKIFYLPSYCPELNPDEFLNQDTKVSLEKKRPRNRPEMIKNLKTHLQMRQRQPKVVQSFVKACNSAYIA
jgi:transposase